MNDLELATKAAQSANLLVADLVAMAASETPAIARVAHNELPWARAHESRLAMMATLIAAVPRLPGEQR